MTGEPPTGHDQLVCDLRGLGVRDGQDLLIHCSLRKVGPPAGGAAALLAALREVAGPAATLVVPAETTGNSLSSRAFRAATAGLDQEGLTRYIAAMPGFDPAATPSAGMGTFAEHVRTRPGACRSSHPQSSFAAVGPRAAAAMAVHDLECHLGERSPLGWLYAADAAVVLLGVGYAACTAFHLAEYRMSARPRQRQYQCFTASDGNRAARAFTDIELADDDFQFLGAALEAADWPDRSAGPRHGPVGKARSRFLPVRTAVDFARDWLDEHRGGNYHEN